MLEVFYCVASGGTAAEGAISQWSVVALALSPCIKNIRPDTHSTDEWQTQDSNTTPGTPGLTPHDFAGFGIAMPG